MTSNNHELIYVFLWIGSRVVGIVFLVLSILFAYHSGQFTNQDRARYLPLEDKYDL